MKLKLNQKVAVESAKHGVIATGTIESFQFMDGPNGKFDVIKVREAGIALIIALPENVRLWKAGDPEPQERIYVDQPRAIGKKQPSVRIPVVATSEDFNHSNVGPVAVNTSRPAPKETRPSRSIKEIMSDVAEAAGDLDEV